tara:strand:- start:740 stop:1186 length:447 start_codon:yes stop_codon:yes gene_type:complete
MLSASDAQNAKGVAGNGIFESSQISDDQITDSYEFGFDLDHRVDRDRFSAQTGLFIVESGPKAGAVCSLQESTVTIGRHSNADFLLDDVTVSRKHAEVRHSGEHYTVIDRGSLNGTYLNGVRIEEADLNDGDVVQIGRFKLIFFHGTK